MESVLESDLVEHGLESVVESDLWLESVLESDLVDLAGMTVVESVYYCCMCDIVSHC